MSEWFKTWFDTPFYHILYGHRNEDEANDFIQRIVKAMQLKKHCYVLDAGCGKGRHSAVLENLGFNTCGIDLSEASINSALLMKNEHLEFYRHDIRKPFRTNYFNAVLSLFTSFGYFDSQEDDVKCIQNFYSSLKNEGLFLIDYLNANKVLKLLPYSDDIIKCGINFKIHKFADHQFIRKKIGFIADNNQFEFAEQVRIYSQQELSQLVTQCGFKVLNVWGSYSLDQYNPGTSDRLIILAKKLN